MAKASIVLGLQFGDEGKGVTTDYLCSLSKNPIVIRYSGGHNCGHNVIIGDKQHIHSSYGSGTLRGVPSYFSEHTCIYLPNIFREKAILAKKGINPKLFVHPLAMVTTPYDVAYNRALEMINDHGSVGVGISSTMNRNLTTGFKLYAMDLQLEYSHLFKAKLVEIEMYYSRKAAALARLSVSYHEQLRKLQGDVDSHNLLISANQLPFQVIGYDKLSYYDDLIFEGSQGIMLDMDHGIFPNVTYAHTTSKNALEILRKAPLSLLDTELFYVTRCYQTRHGNGWMSDVANLDLINAEEEINVHNQWQGHFRTGKLDYELLNYAMEVDNLYSSPFRKNLVVTCLDQRPTYEFHYEKIRQRMFCHYENHSAKHGGMIKTC